MFPNQPPPTSTTAAAGTSQTATTTVQSATSATLTQAIVAAANTTSMPETTAAPVQPPQSVQQGAQRAARRVLQSRAQPYHSRTPAIQTAASLPQAVVTAAQSYQHMIGASGAMQATSSAAVAPAMLAPRVPAGGQSASRFALTISRYRGAGGAFSQLDLQEFFDILFKDTGMMWNGGYTSSDGNGNAAVGSVSPFALHFPDSAITACSDAALKELLLRVNNETNLECRKYLLVKALRAFSEKTSALAGVFDKFGFLLDVNWNSVINWTVSNPRMPTAVARNALSDAALTLPLPMDILGWPEVQRALQYYIPALSSSPTAAGASTESDPRVSVAGLSFTENFIGQQCVELQALIRGFHVENTPENRAKLFCKIICVLKELLTIPFGTYPRVCDLLGVSRPNTTSWFMRYKETIRDREFNESRRRSEATAPALVVQTLATASATPARLPQQILPTHTAAISSAQRVMPQPVFIAPTMSMAPIASVPSTVQMQVSPILFTAPITPTTPNISAAQLDPTLLPFTQSTPAPSLEDLLALPIMQDPGMEMDVDSILKDLDF